jgi:RNA polymerase sigma factor (TIGR02999 family)
MTLHELTDLDVSGRRDIADVPIEAVYDDLRRIARVKLAEVPAHSVGATDVVHEAVARLIRSKGSLEGIERTHLVSLAARAMRNVVVDRARARGAVRRARPAGPLTLGAAALPDDSEALQIHDALAALAENDPRAAKVVELLYFGGLTQPEIADHLGVSERTVRRDWRFARAWLLREVGDGAE